MDRSIRTLQRDAATGDPSAVQALHRAEERAGLITTGELQNPDPLNGNPLAEWEGSDIHRTVADGDETSWPDRIVSSSPDHWTAQQNHNGPVEAGNLIPIPHTMGSTSYSDPDSVDRANRAQIENEHAGECCAEGAAGIDGCACDPEADTPNACDWLEDHNGQLMIRVSPYPCVCDPDDEWGCEARILDTLQGLADYPLIDDCLHGRIEMHDQEEQWADWGKNDFETIVQKEYPDMDLDGVDWDALAFGGRVDTDMPMEGLATMAEQYPEGSGDNISFPYSAWLEALELATILAFGGILGD